MGLKDVLVATAMMTTVFALMIYYVIPMPFDKAMIAGLVVTLCVVMLHEGMHLLYAEEVCRREATFTLTSFAINTTLISILILSILILIKKYTGWYSYLIPVIASPGGVYVVMRKADKCYDNVAVVAPFVNLLVGIACLFYLFTVTSPPFVLNDLDNFGLSLIAMISFFSFSLAFINALPIKIGNVATDGYWAMTVDRRDLITKALTIVTILISTYVLFFMKIFAVEVVA